MPKTAFADKMAALDGTIKGIGDILKNHKAPAIVGKPIFAKDMEAAKACGGKSMGHIFGQKAPLTGADPKDKPFMRCLNFGSKSDTMFMETNTRLRLFQFKKNFHLAEIQAQILSQMLNPTLDVIMSTPAWKEFVEPMAKAFDVTDFSSWVPSTQARFYFEEFELPHILRNLFDTQPMDSPTITVPGALGLLEGQLETDIATFTEQSNTQDDYSIIAKNNVVHTKITEDLMQDSAPAIIDKLRREVVQGIGRAEERALVRGDTTAPHMDSDLQALPKTFAKAYKGLVKRATEAGATHVYDHLGATPDKDLWRKMMMKMGKFASEKSDLKWVYTPLVETDLVTGAIPELFTAFAFGERASNVTGAVPPVFGANGVTSEFMRDDLNASGVYDGITSNLSSQLLVKTSRFSNYLRQAIRVWAAPSLPSSDTMLMTAKMRHSFAGNPQSADEISVVYAKNVAQS